MKLKSNLDEILYQKIIESLICGEYALGQKIMLDEFCKKFEVSRTPVVQAVKLLSKDGVLTVMSNGRVCVPEYEKSTLQQVCDVRRLIEGHALEIIMDSPERIERAYGNMMPHADRCRDFLGEKQYVKIATEDLALHRTLVEAAENDVLANIYTGVQGRFIVANYLVRPLKDRDYAGTVEDHYRLLEAIRSGNKEKALASLMKHIGGIAMQTEE